MGQLMRQRKPVAFAKRDGIVLPGVIILFVSITIMGLAYLSFCAHESRSSLRHLNQTRSYYIAEAGIERACSELHEDWDSATDFGGEIGRGQYQVTFVEKTTTRATVQSRGEVLASDGTTVLASRLVSARIRR